MNKISFTTLCFILFAFLTPLKSNAQMWSVGVYLNGLNIHLKRPVNGHLFHRILTKNKRLVYNLGMGIRVTYYFNNYAGITLMQALVPYDCGNKMFGMSQVGLSLSSAYWGYAPHELILMGGPVLFYRKNWNTLPDYKNDGLFKVSNNNIWQYKWVWHGGFIEYNYHYNKNNALGLYVIPGIPELISISGQHTSYIK